jgi:hypothetical protein
MQSGKRLTLKDYFAKHTRTHKNHKNTNVELLLSLFVNCQVQLFLDNMVLANQNAKLTGPDQGFLVSLLVLIGKPWERGCNWEQAVRIHHVEKLGNLHVIYIC